MRLLFAQSVVSRLSYNCIETHQAPTSSRLGEPLSPERDDTSLKTKALRLSESESRNLSQPLLFLPRRDGLAWARISVLAIVRTCSNHTYIPKTRNEAFHTTTVAYKSYKLEASQKWTNNQQNTRNPSFPYLERASKILRHQTVEHNNLNNGLMSWKIAKQIFKTSLS